MQLLVITNETAEGDLLHDAIRGLASAPGDRVEVVAPEGASHWLERDLVSRACVRFDLPVAHIVVDVRQPSALVAAA